jgi:Sulfatase
VTVQAGEHGGSAAAPDEVSDPPASADGDGAEHAGDPLDEGRRWYVAEALLALEIAGLAAFAFSRSTLDTFGRSPETFVARGADAVTIVAFGLVVAVVPAVTLALVGLAGRPLGPMVRRWVHLALVAAVGGLAVWQLGQTITDRPLESKRLILAGVVGGLVLALVRFRWPTSRTFLRLIGAASVIFLVQFLVMSPTADLVTGDASKLDDDVVGAVAADLGDDPPDVVMLTFDALPTVSLLDGTGHIDADTFPNFARLADTSNWYRNNTSVAAFTWDAVPTLVTGRYRPGSDGRGALDAENLFTLLGGSYDMHVREAVTRMCAGNLCPRTDGAGLDRLLADAAEAWTGSQNNSAEFELPGALGDDRYSHASQWIDGLELSPDRADLVFYHTVMPHAPWYVTGEGEPYESLDIIPTGTFGMGWTRSGYPVGHQRHLLQLQAIDRLLGQLLDTLEEQDALDDSLVVVTADHGESFVPDQLMRGLTDANEAQVMWTPLFVKAPGQTEPRVDDANVLGIDVMPTVADMLGVDLPWEVDGTPVTEVGERDDTKPFLDHEGNGIHAEEGEDRFVVDRTDALFEDVLRYDPTEFDGVDALWKRTAHGELFGQTVDELRVGEAYDGSIDVRRLDDIAESGRGAGKFLEVVGDTDLPQGSIVAYGLNGTIGAVTAVEPGIGHDGLAHGLLPPRLFADGGNELTAYLVEGPVGGETLRPLDVAAG